MCFILHFILSTFGVGEIFRKLLDAGSTIRRAAGVFGWTTPPRVAEAVVQAVEYDAQPQTFQPTRWAPDPVISRGPFNSTYRGYNMVISPVTHL